MPPRVFSLHRSGRRHRSGASLLSPQSSIGRRSRRFRQARLVGGLVVLAALVATLGLTPAHRLLLGSSSTAAPAWATAPAAPPQHATASGAFLGSDATGIQLMPQFDAWRGGRVSAVGHTYLPGGSWSDIEGPSWLVQPWAAWRTADPNRLLVLNVPMSDANEAGLTDAQVADRLRRGAAGEFDQHYQVLAQRLVAAGAGDTVIVLGWEMNGDTYSGRCGPDPQAWQSYWQRIVTTMRQVPGAAFRFDFAPSRGEDAVAWPQCYPGDRYVDIIGMDTYDQDPGTTFQDYIDQPYGLKFQVEFAAAHGKPVSYPEWGLFRRGDDPAFIQGMHDWIATHDVVYETVTDYCPHGVWQCGAQNPKSAALYQKLFGPGSTA